MQESPHSQIKYSMHKKLLFLLPFAFLLMACQATEAQQPPAPASPTFEPDLEGVAWGYTQDCAETTGTVETFEVNAGSEITLESKIYLPPCYEADPDAVFPVLYLFHGQGGNVDTWLKAGAFSTADELISKGDIGPALIVLPPTMAFDSTFDVVFANVIVPYVDANYRTVPSRHYRALGGMSAGAGLALRIGAQQPQIASVWGLHSVAAVEGIERVDVWLNAIPDVAEPHIYMDVGNLDPLLEAAVIINALLVEENLPHTFIVRAGEHNMAYWTVHMPEYLNWYDAAFKDPE